MKRKREIVAKAAKRHPSALPVLLVCIWLGGCGYQQQGGRSDRNISPGYQWHSLYREDIQTVAVPVFTNISYRRGIEISLSKAIIQDIEAAYAIATRWFRRTRPTRFWRVRSVRLPPIR